MRVSTAGSAGLIRHGDLGRPDQIAAMVRFLIGPEPATMSGQTQEASCHDH